MKKNPPKQLLSCRIAAEVEETAKVENTDLRLFKIFLDSLQGRHIFFKPQGPEQCNSGTVESLAKIHAGQVADNFEIAHLHN